MDRLGIDFLSVFGMPADRFVHLAADLGCRYIGLGLMSYGANPHGYPDYSLRPPEVRRAVQQAMRDRGVSPSMGEGFLLWPERDFRKEAEPDLDLLFELGARRICALTLDPDRARSLDQLGAIAEMVAERGGETVIEFVPETAVPDLPAALELIGQLGRSDVKVLIDTMHLLRSGSTPADVAALDPGMIGYLQLCDSLKTLRFDSYNEEAAHERMVPGTGELPLLETLKALPRDVHVGLEAPMLRAAQAGVGPYERLKPWVEAARRLLAEAEA
jgi:sugar phosphate isomerase/epimerase